MRRNWRRMLATVTLIAGVSAIGAAQQRPTLPVAGSPVSSTAKVSTSPTSSVSSPHGPELRVACANCHRADGWKPARFGPNYKHAEKTFPLNGAHERTACMSCHKTLTFQGASTGCASCHADSHKGEFGTSCARCHNTRSFVDRGSAVRTHQGTRFPLRGAHAIATCEACHAPTAAGQPQFAARSTTCESCHLATFRATRSPNHEAAHFARDCATCHTISTWSGATFDHNTTKFPLTGKHQVATCAGCHADGVYAGRSTSCNSCHVADYQAAREPRHDVGFPTNCESCHATNGWKGAKFDHQTLTKYPLTGRHLAVECKACHTSGVFRGLPSTCASCHTNTFNATTAPNHKTVSFATACESCHTTAAWLGGQFDHNTTRFPLTGGHRTATCVNCHADKVYRGKPTTCVSCHQAKFNATTKPDHKAGGFPTTCETCHTNVSWTPGTFNHDATRFPLTGAHRATSCVGCHADGVYRGKALACASCHQSNFDRSTNPHHGPAGFAATCESCHTTTAWAGGRFDHSSTRFALTGKHVSQTCIACHNDRVYKGKPSACAACHQTKYDATTDPNHRQLGFPTNCESCHTTNQWEDGKFDHAATRFPLTGGHLAITCRGCHADGVFKGKSMTCVSCHQSKFDATTNPHHAAARFATACETCHTTTSWPGARYDHNATSFPLTGKHVTQTCLACHSDRVYQGKPTTCISCHQAKFDATTAPNHKASNFPTTCESCHSTSSWTNGAFDHNATRFPLTGGHRAVSCAGCHGDGVYKGKSLLCASCHQAKFDATTKPSHRASAFPTTCETCHTNVAWTPATFDHNTTRFPLTGGHRTPTCAQCHGDGVYRGKSLLCASCHQAKYDATTRPSHRASAFPTTCESCHTNLAWTPATFDHNTTAFPLVGAHRAVSCVGCHADGVYKGKPTTCVSCHQAKFDATTSPNHRTSGFPTSCETCHTATAWTPATFDHSTTRFPLTGLHRTATCTQCHGDGVFRGKTMLCAGCHQTNYNATTKPNHAQLGYSTSCESCHTTAGWTPSTWSHAVTKFPLTGAHIATACLACHSDLVYRGKPTTCSSCHTTDYNATTNPNHKTAAFPLTCESCHTTTKWLGAVFNHDQWFPIYSGKHLGRWNTCADCHANNANYKEFTCLTCHTKSRTDSQHQGRSGYSYTSPACYSCHPRGSAG